jgi:hypothetical protein
MGEYRTVRTILMCVLNADAVVQDASFVVATRNT